MLDGEGIQEGELIGSLKIWAKGSEGRYPPRPANLLEIIKRERILAIRRAELKAWRDAGCPTIDAEGVIHFDEAENSKPVRDVIRAATTHFDAVARRLDRDG